MNQLPLTIVGNLTGDPELRFTAAGAAVVKFTIAHNPRRLDRVTGEWTNGDATFIDCAAWRDLAEHVAETLQSGHRVIAYGHLRTDRWESDGSGKSAAGDIIARQILDVLAIGPELTFATAKVIKATSTRRGEAAPDDPWATASPARPAEPAAAAPGKTTKGTRARGSAARQSNFDDEPPF